ncbi:MAG: uroporphyrinogen decarboxylase family protein [candidate division WOR-3 bacterium]
MAEVVTQPTALARALFSAYRFYDYDGITVFTDTVVEAEAMGAQVIIPEDEDPFLLMPPQVSRLEPADPDRDGRMPVVLEAILRLSELTGGRATILGSLKGPFSLASMLAGTERFLIDLIGQPDRARDFLLVATENQRRYLSAIVRSGAVPFIGDPVASGSVISPEQFSNFAQPYLKRLVEDAHSMGSPVGLHVCGDTSRILGQLFGTGADFVSIEDVRLVSVYPELDGKATIMGGVSTTLLLDGTAEDVQAEVRRSLELRLSRLILSSGCDVPVQTPFENIRAMVAAVREWSS